MCTVFCRGNQKERYHWRDPDVDGKIILRLIESRYMYRILVRKPNGKRPLGRPTRRWEDNIKMNGRRSFAQGSGGES
jgi:hypothetical protein